MAFEASSLLWRASAYACRPVTRNSHCSPRSTTFCGCAWPPSEGLLPNEQQEPAWQAHWSLLERPDCLQGALLHAEQPFCISQCACDEASDKSTALDAELALYFCSITLGAQF